MVELGTVDVWRVVIHIVCGVSFGVACGTIFALGVRQLGAPPRQAPKALPPSCMPPPDPAAELAVVKPPPAPHGADLGTALAALFVIALVGAALGSSRKRHDS